MQTFRGMSLRLDDYMRVCVCEHVCESECKSLCESIWVSEHNDGALNFLTLLGVYKCLCSDVGALLCVCVCLIVSMYVNCARA